MKGYRWSVEVEGGSHLAALLSAHFPDVETEIDEQGSLFIAHRALETAQDRFAAREATEELLASILPSLAIFAGHLPHSVVGGTVREHDRNDNVQRKSVYVEVHDAFHAHTALSAQPADQQLSAPVRTASQRAQALIAVNPDFSEAARRFRAAGQDVRQLYIVYEHLRDHICGGPQHWKKLAQLGWVTETELNHFRETANNVHRHKEKPMAKPMPPGEARALIGRLMAHWVNRDMPSKL